MFHNVFQNSLLPIPILIPSHRHIPFLQVFFNIILPSEPRTLILSFSDIQAIFLPKKSGMKLLIHNMIFCKIAC